MALCQCAGKQVSGGIIVNRAVTGMPGIVRSMSTGTLEMPWKLGDTDLQPSGGPVTFEIQDFMHCRGNRIRIKEGWIDGLAIRDQLAP